MMDNRQTKVLVTGAGGFIGHHLVKYLKRKGYWVRGASLLPPLYEGSEADEFLSADLTNYQDCREAVDGVEEVYQLAANMGGIGFISAEKARVMHDNVLINTHMIEAARAAKVGRYFYGSSACIYPLYLQDNTDVEPLREDCAYPAQPEDGYGWEKLFSERQARHYYDEYGLETRTARFHNIYGPLGAYDGGREKAPAALCRKIAMAQDGDEIEVWGDGEQTRSYCYISDCVEGIDRIMHGHYYDPLNLGSDKLVSVNQMIDIIATIAGKRIYKRHDMSKPQGVRGRNSDNRRIKTLFDWEPQTTLIQGLTMTYNWIAGELAEKSKGERI